MKLKKLLKIDFKKEKLSLALVLWLFSFLLHNFLSDFPIISAFFFIITIFIIPAYLIISIIYSLVKK
jgi:hypothetical protein